VLPISLDCPYLIAPVHVSSEMTYLSCCCKENIKDICVRRIAKTKYTERTCLSHHKEGIDIHYVPGDCRDEMWRPNDENKFINTKSHGSYGCH
jgi:hypothetical protein